MKSLFLTSKIKILRYIQEGGLMIGSVLGEKSFYTITRSHDK